MIWRAKSKRSLMLWWVLNFFKKKNFSLESSERKGLRTWEEKMYADLYRLGRRIGGLLIPVSSDGRLCHADEPKRNQTRSMAVFRWFTFKTRALVQTQATQSEYDVLYFFFFPSFSLLRRAQICFKATATLNRQWDSLPLRYVTGIESNLCYYRLPLYPLVKWKQRS